MVVVRHILPSRHETVKGQFCHGGGNELIQALSIWLVVTLFVCLFSWYILSSKAKTTKMLIKKTNVITDTNLAVSLLNPLFLSSCEHSCRDLLLPARRPCQSATLSCCISSTDRNQSILVKTDTSKSSCWKKWWLKIPPNTIQKQAKMLRKALSMNEHHADFIEWELIQRCGTDHDFDGWRREFPRDGTWDSQVTVTHQCVLASYWVGAVLFHVGQQILQQSSQQMQFYFLDIFKQLNCSTYKARVK